MTTLGKAGKGVSAIRERNMYEYLKEQKARKGVKTPPRFQAATGNALDDMHSALGTLRNFVVKLEAKAKEYETARKRASVQRTTITRQEFGRLLRGAADTMSKEARKYDTED